MTRNGGKNRMMLCSLAVCSLLLVLSMGYGQSGPLADEPLKHRQFDEEKLNDIRENEAYQYGKEPIREVRSVDDAEADEGISVSIWTFLMYTLVLVMLGALAFFVWQKTMGSSGKNILEQVEFETEQDIRKLDLKEMLVQALSKKDYRLGVRLLYLSTLKSLSKGGLIDWQPNKTNQDYRRELAATSLARDFDLLTLQFDYIWYGNIPVGAQHYDRVSDMFEQFQRKTGVQK